MGRKRWMIVAAVAAAAAPAALAWRHLAVSRRRRPPPIDHVEQAGLDSFPASDPPGWTLGERDGD